MTRLAVLSDIHGNLSALEAVLSDIKSHGAPDAYWFLGDLVAFAPWPAQTLARLRALPGADFLQGNTDRYLITGRRPNTPVNSREDWDRMPKTLRERDANFRWTVERLSYKDYEFLRDLPTQLSWNVPGFGQVVAFHATPQDDETVLHPSMTQEELQSYVDDLDARLVLYGHTHRPMNRPLDGIRLVNSGSVGLPLDGDPRPSYVLLDFEDGECDITIRRVQYDREKVIAELERLEHPARSWVEHILREAKTP